MSTPRRQSLRPPPTVSDARHAFSPPFMERVEVRLQPEDAGFASGSPIGEPRVRGWFRLRENEPIDTLALLLIVDAFPPTAFNARLPVAWTPTVELTAHVRGPPGARLVAVRLHDPIRDGWLPRRRRRGLGRQRTPGRPESPTRPRPPRLTSTADLTLGGEGRSA